ncbi:bifunctional diguanylate cyclase/phosphodiesterase [Paracidovorax sp. MALMAid1276]|uniref:bifunctional diguanylate cyclase/phosphodiesterase n=1 Tax=Paracidovorax sp. MALMAid1276 TaxID=3411631 RepID=UPI003B9B36A8
MSDLLEQLSASVSSAQTVEDLTRPLLEMLEAVTGLESTYLTAIDEAAGLQHVLYARNSSAMQIPEGLSVPWNDTLCKRALEEGRTYTDDVPGCWGDSEAAQALGIRTYVSKPVRMGNGALFGTLCAASSESRPKAPQADRILTLFAFLIGQQVEREQLIHQLLAANEQLASVAATDQLTGLPNRRALTSALQRMLAQGWRLNLAVQVAFIDLDGFKSINDTYGHEAGDQFLVAVAQRLQGVLRADDLAARLGGDEFVVVLTDVGSPEDAAVVTDKLLGAMHGVFTIDQLPIIISPSIGIALYPEHGHNAAQLLRCADAAMHHAKESGRGNRQFYDPSMDASALDVLRHERLLREAIADGAFELHYQPQVRLSDGALQGLEALVRWRHPERGLIGPDEFITFAESRGLITPIGRWVLREACRQLKAWQAEGLAMVPVAVNLSALEFRQRDVAAEIAAVLRTTGLAPQYLEIELTESVLMHQTGQALDTLNALKALGVGISVDDFGTGYSSLAYLKRYPIDKLKIDRSFVMDTPGNADDVAIVTAVIQMGRSLQLKTVAEGVETQAQVELLRGLGCDQIQGHVVAVPMEGGVAGEWLAANTAVR